MRIVIHDYNIYKPFLYMSVSKYKKSSRRMMLYQDVKKSSCRMML